MSNKLKDNVLFINVDGIGLDLFNFHSEYRIRKVNEIKHFLIQNGCKVKLLNPTKLADIKIPNFKIQSAPKSNEYTDELDYSIFIIKHLYHYIKNENFTHIIIFQYDGFPVKIDSWDDEFLNFDLIGNTDFQIDENENIEIDNLFSLEKNRQGMHFNGGFSLRSRRLLEKCLEIPMSNFTNLYKKYGCTNEDLLLLDCIDYNKIALNKKIIRKFVDNKIETQSFGFHKK